MGVDYKYCPYCGQETYEQGARDCPSCGKAYPNVNISPDNRNENSYSNEVMSERPLKLLKFNWGAFCFSWLWAVFNGMPWMILCILFGAIMVSLEDTVHSDNRIWFIFVRVICVLTLSVIFGIFGNRWAWKYKKWKSVQHFEFVQKNWKQAGFIIVIGPFLLGIILLIVLLVIHGF